MTSGGRELLKWVALVLMTGDHVNKVFFAGQLPALTEAARVVFPIFAFVLAWNLEHAPAASRSRSLRRLLLAGVIVQPLHASAFGYWLPANVLLTLALGIAAADRALPLPVRVLAVLVAPLFVDYQWSGVGFFLASALVIRHVHRPAWAWLSLAAALVPLCVYNGNAWALLALPMLWWLGRLEVEVPRWRWTFLGYYAGHLAALAVIGMVG
jgi:TraX protein.